MPKFPLVFLFIIFAALLPAAAQQTQSKLIKFPKPKYPEEAKSVKASGKVEVSVAFDEKGKVLSAEALSGHPLLRDSAVAAAKEAKFETTVKGNALLTYNFSLFSITESYFDPPRLEGFRDIKKEAPHYEAVLNLAENYKVAFAYGDGNFHAELPLTRCDFSHFLRKTLDMLAERVVVSGKNAKDISLFNTFNPYALKAYSDMRPDSEKSPCLDSIRALFEKYGIALAEKENKLNEKLPMSNNEVIMLWEAVFGLEAIPVNFEKKIIDNHFSRGEFAIFLHESLEYLSYKVLP